MADVDPATVRKPRSRRRKKPDTNDPVDIAMSLASDSDAARDLLEKQARLVEADLVHRRWQIATERAAAAFKTLLALAALVILVALGAMIWEARNSRGIIVESFTVPPSLAAQGLGGETVASKILDRLTDMRARSTSSRAADALESGWRDEYRVAIPQTGLSIGEVRTALRRWLGNDTRISGEVYRSPRGLALTVRTNRAARGTFEGSEGDFDSLASQAAEDVFRKTSPHLYANYVYEAGRRDEAVAIWWDVASTHADRRERAWALSALGIAHTDQGRCAEAIPVLERAISLEPNLPNPHGNLAIAHICQGHKQLGVDSWRRSLDISRSGRAVDQDPVRLRRFDRESEAGLAAELGDYRSELRLAEEMERNGQPAWAQRAEALAGSGDVAASMRALAEARLSDPGDRLQYWFHRFRQAVALQDWRAAASFASRGLKLCVESGPRCSAQWPVRGQPAHAVAVALAGDHATAEAMLRVLPRDCYDCAWARAAVSEARGDRGAADRWFGEAVRLGPRLPFAFHEWGKAKLARGDAAGALPQFDRALTVAPEHVHAFKGRGDALARLGRHREALRAYDAAAERAPRWGALHVNWGLALWRAGRRDEAREKWRAAAGMDLGRADGARLRRILARAGRTG